MTDMRSLQNTFVLFFLSLLLAVEAPAQDGLLSDANSDGQTLVTTIGDSITFGIGDGVAAGSYVEMAPSRSTAAGYPLRLSRDLGIAVENGGVPGEIFTDGGSARALTLLLGSSADLFLLLEGSNDAVFQISPSAYGFELQKILNIADVLGKQLVPITLPVPCCDRDGQRIFTNAYSVKIRDLAAVNDLPIIDLEQSWATACPVPENCTLLNRPEGLHPNTSGYDFIAKTVKAALTGQEEVEEMTEEGEEES